MTARVRPISDFRPSLAFASLVAFLAILCLAGGASQADVSGQIVVRAAAWVLLVAALLFGDRPDFRPVGPVLFLLLGAMALALLQLAPLPPSWWLALPGRAIFADAALASGQVQPWRPWSIVPGATVNAASSLIVPLVVLLLAAGLAERERRWLPGILLGLVTAEMLIGLMQLSGGGPANPFLRGNVGQVSGTLANRNHYALVLGFGCLLAPLWAFAEGRRPGWRGSAALGLVLLFELTILACGSRAGLVLGVLALVAGLLLVQRDLRRELARHPRWVLPALGIGVVALASALLALSAAADRVASVSRVFEIDQGQEMRVRALPAVLEMVRTYFPWGSGLGGFDTIFRLHEPFHLLKLTYFNHAHDDLLEIVVDAGLPGLLLLASGIAWWAWASVRAWRGGRSAPARAGSVILALILFASIVDYPARTPIVMAIGVLAATWLARDGRPALPPTGHHL